MLQWSHTFVPFRPINIRLKTYLGTDLKSGHVCQIVMTPDDKFSVGKYSQSGNGKCYRNDITERDFKEHIHFEFEKA